MGSQVLYRKWRPQTLADVVGQPQVTQTLLNALKSGRISHAYLFCGPRGTGKTSTGRIFAKAINCLSSGNGEPCNTCHSCQSITEGRALDIIEIDAASNTGVENIRDLREKVNYSPGEARYKVYIIDEVHMLSTAASNALLKTLEEPPPHAIFILATTETHKVLPTIISRCQRYDFHRISQTAIVLRLTHIARGEGISVPEEGLRLIARAATGSLRDAANLLEQITTYYGKHIESSQVQANLGITGDARAKEILRQIANADIAAGIKTIHNVSTDGLDLKQFTREVTEHLRALLLVKTGVTEALGFTGEDLAEFRELAGKISLAQILKAVKVFNQVEISMDSYSTLPLELAVVDSILVYEEKKSVPVFARTETPPAVRTLRETAPSPATPVFSPSEVPSDLATAQEAKPVSTPVTVIKENIIPAGTNEIEKLKMGWKQMLDSAPRNNTVALLRSARPESVDGDRVTIVCRYEIHKTGIEKPENVKIAEKMISDYLGRPCRISCQFKPPEANPLVEALKRNVPGTQVTSVEDI